MTASITPDAPEPGAFASEPLDLRLAEWRRAPSVSPVPLELHLLRMSIADYLDHERARGQSYTNARASLLAVLAELPIPAPEGGRVEALASLLGSLPDAIDPITPTDTNNPKDAA